MPDPGNRPPTLPGYVLHTRLGRGGYGEVWLGENRTTKRQVAVKFLHSRATLDWWLLDGETEKLAFLAADRRVVQLLDVGRDADPPFYVMEYVNRGSLARHLESVGPLTLDRAVTTFEEIALGLMHVHAKGILHCDLKPSNILLDDELRPRLADFGQSRPIEDRSPALALGTIFFMAPEQADPAAVPDARWDVYALGAVLYSMLEGRPPHHSDEAVAAIHAEPDLLRRLARYRQIVTATARVPLPLSSRRLDKRLRQILTRCLATDPRERFTTVQEVVEALRLRREARGRRPMMVLGGLGPVLLLAVMAVFGLRGYRQATEQSSDAIRRRAFESNRFAAAFIARSLEGEIRRYLEVVSEEAAVPGFLNAFRTVTALPDLKALAGRRSRIRRTRWSSSSGPSPRGWRWTLTSARGWTCTWPRPAATPGRPASPACSPSTPTAPTSAPPTASRCGPSRSGATTPGDPIFMAAPRISPATPRAPGSPRSSGHTSARPSAARPRTPGAWACRSRCSSPARMTGRRCLSACWSSPSTSATSSS